MEEQLTPGGWTPEHLAQRYAESVRDAIDLIVQGGEDEFPVISGAIVKAKIATRKQLDILEEHGHIKSITVDVPSILSPGRVVQEKAYYTERRVPKLVEAYTN